MLKVRYINKSVFLALGVNIEGQKELLGMWLVVNEGAKFWLNVLTELKNRGLNDILIPCVDGFKGFPDAINTVYPEARIQLCIVHMVRNSLRYVSWKDYKAIPRALKAIYLAPTEERSFLKLISGVPSLCAPVKSGMKRKATTVQIDKVRVVRHIVHPYA
ncbi:transposase mutator type [Enterobacter cancerogenus]|uniref:Mutator family transposase n=1 Tax=Enterobacter cancerogenus TaxID=69218 RepID=A0A484XH93_9ENTR|nr:transposase mutator type [Enterobacter cancerogenus]